MSEVLDPRAARKESQPEVREAKLVSSLLSISKSTRALVGLKLSEVGFHNGQDELLFALDEATSISVSILADSLGVRPSTVSKMLDRLIDGGTAERVPDKQDARRTMVRITPAGMEARRRLSDMRAALETELVSSLPGNGQSVVGTLEDVSAILKARLSRYR